MADCSNWLLSDATFTKLQKFSKRELSAYTTLFLSLLFLNLSIAQTPFRDQYLGENGRDDARIVFQNLNGDYVVVGTNRYHGDRRGNDLYFAELDSTLRVGTERQDIGSAKNDEVYAALQAYDGSYVLAGYTDSAEQHLGGKDAWLLKMREDGRGDPLLNLNLGSAQDDIFYALAQDSESNLIAGGTRNGKFWFTKLTANGTEIWSVDFPTNGRGEVRDLLLTDQDEIIATGFEMPTDDNYTMLTLKISGDGREQWRASLPNVRANAICKSQNGGYAITGDLVDGREEQLFVAHISNGGQIMWQQNYGERGRDGGNAIIQKMNSNYLVAGHSMSYERGAKRARMWLLEMNAQGEWVRDTVYGGRSADIGHDVLETYTGETLLLGESASGKRTEGTDGWLLQFSATETQQTERLPILEISNVQLVTPAGNNRLDPYERAYLAFDLTNNSMTPAYQLQANLEATERVRGCKFYDRAQFGTLAANRTRRLAIPVWGENDLATGVTNLNLQIRSVNGGTAQQQNITIESLKEALPELQLVDAQFITPRPDGIGQTDELLKLQVKLKNTGLAAAERVRVKFAFPYKVTAHARKEINISELPAGAEHLLEFLFQAEATFLEDSIRIGCRVTEAQYDYGTEGEYFLPLESSLLPDIVTSDSVAIEPTATEVAPVAETTPAPPPVVEVPKIRPYITWVKPQFTQITNDYIAYTEPRYDLRILVTSPTSIDRQNVQVYVNGNRYDTGRKTEIVRYSSKSNRICEQNANGLYACFFDASIQLYPGKNDIELRVVDKGETLATSKSLRIDYQPQGVALHVLSIGVNYPNRSLRYTDEDARDIAVQYAALEGTAFTKVHRQVLTTTAETTKQGMEDALNALKNRFVYESEGIDRSDDMVVVFISAHGFIEGQELYLEGSDNEGVNKNARSLELRGDILKTLRNLPCARKLVLIDACRSDIHRSDKSYEFLGSDIPVLFSTRAGDLSYEHADWENGVFTEAILSAFANPSVTDRNENQRISTWELYNYIYRAMPDLLENVKGLGKAEQTPYMEAAWQTDEWDVFYGRGYSRE